MRSAVSPLNPKGSLMHRRVFVLGLLAVPTLSIDPLRACDIDPTLRTEKPSTWIRHAERQFTWPDQEGPRSVHARVREFSTDSAAEAAQDARMRLAVPETLPPGEFYGSGLQIVAVPDVPEGFDVRVHAWHTTVGVAAYTTAFTMFTVRAGPILWDGTVVTSRPETAHALAMDVIDKALVGSPPCGNLEDTLPDADSLPDGAEEQDIPYDGTPESG